MPPTTMVVRSPETPRRRLYANRTVSALLDGTLATGLVKGGRTLPTRRRLTKSRINMSAAELCLKLVDHLGSFRLADVTGRRVDLCFLT